VVGEPATPIQPGLASELGYANREV
jgi:hypothetical protein